MTARTEKKLDAGNGTPLYEQLIEKICQNIENGTFPIGRKIPAETELGKIYGVSRITVRRAIEELTAKGLIECKQGKGTFVKAPYVSSESLKKICSFHEACAMVGKKPSTKVLANYSENATERDCNELQMRSNTHVVVITRLRLADGQPVMLETNRFSMAYSYLLDSDLDGSLYIFLKGYGVEASAASHDISLCQATSAQAKWLKINEGDPLIYLHEVVYDQNGRPLHTSDQYIRGDIFTLRV